MPADATSPKKLRENRAALTHRTGYALRHPGRVVPYLRRAGRDAWLRLKHPDHIGYYRAVMASDTRRSPEAAVGSRTHDRWPALGRMQFDYLVEHGMRGGRRFISRLDAGNYYGIDISPDILMAAKKTLVERRVQDELPHLTITGDLTLGFLPDDHFDVVHAHSVFSHSPLEVIEQCLAHVGRVLTDTGFFDFTFDRTETLLALVQRHGLHARFMADWEKRPHGQSRIRVSRSPLPAA
ncbi:class I SAM-dependent methyltransferase [Streptomyces sp. NPDC007901]|uniref:class I SAM-dependent methyltransferase n=1 Tax=Streptomyces sp. NPDC007901 TaxID=3364785 RepID=UPI0036F04E30